MVRTHSASKIFISGLTAILRLSDEYLFSAEEIMTALLSPSDATAVAWEPVPLVEGVSGSASLFCERFRCADLAVGSGNAQAGASKIGMQRGNCVVTFYLFALTSRVPENQVELSRRHHNTCTIASVGRAAGERLGVRPQLRDSLQRPRV